MITVIGEALIDLVPVPDSCTLRALPGGGPLQVAIGAARLGYPTALMARLSSDPFGQLLRRHACRNGVDLDASPDADEPTTLSIASAGSEPGSEPGRLYYRGTADWQWSTEELARIPAATTILHIGSLACCVAPGASRIHRAAARLRRRGALISISLNARPDVMGSPARGRLLVERTIGAADLVRASARDIAWLYPGRALTDVAGQWTALGPELVVITCGADGALAVRGSRAVLHRPGYRGPVVDTAGAGDAFTAALLGGLYQLSQAGAGFWPLGGPDLGRLLDLASAAGGLTCRRRGAELPTAAELEIAARPGPAPRSRR
ncbi:MAG TPA: PfkB family carbohydrate kinase [Streptosporangiaceae bacterium]|nr:PfkB family carbohydrate kinase [Streptosporangiaceae bacterium]